MDCLLTYFKYVFSDSDIAKNFHSARTKDEWFDFEKCPSFLALGIWSPCYITYRSIKLFIEVDFCNDLSNSQWNILDACCDADDMLDLWYQLFIKVVDKHLPIRRVKH